MARPVCIRNLSAPRRSGRALCVPAIRSRMNKYADILFKMLKSHVDAHTAQTAKRVVATCSPKRPTAGVQRAVEAQIREALDLQAWYFLCLFDNVGCTLPGGVLGYRLL